MSAGIEPTSLDFPAEWNGLVGIYGGYALAKLADVAESATNARLSSLSARFISPVRPGRATITRDALHSGRRTEVARLMLEQAGRTRIEASAICIPTPATLTWQRPWLTPDTDDVPGPDAWKSHPHAQGELAFLRNLEMRTPPSFEVRDGSSAWFRLASPPATLGLDSPHAVACALMDALLPVLFASHPRPAFVPTIEFTVHFSPLIDEVNSGWILGRNRLEWANDDYCVEDATLTTAGGVLLAQQRQIRLIRWIDEENAR